MELGNGLADKFDKLFENAIKPNQPENTVYHYTTFAGLSGILESQRLWLTDYRYLNDSSEIDHARKEVLKVMHDVLPTLSSKKPWLMFYYIFRTFPQIHHFYIFSTCERCDYLPAWRAYADNGAGFAIAFEKDFFEPSPEPNNRCCSSAKVHYNINDLEDYIRNLFNTVDTQSVSNEEELQTAFSCLATYLIGIYPWIKHNAYEEEIEYRILEVEEDQDKCFSRNCIVPKENKIWSPDKKTEIPFVNSIPRIITPKFSTNQIKEIWIGPRCKQKHAESVVKKMLETYDYDKTEIKFSVIPYR